MIRVLLADDHELVRVGFRRILEEAHDVSVVGEAATGEDAVRLARETSPDVVLMDVNMPGIGGIEATRRIRAAQRKTQVIAVTVHTDDPFPSKLTEAGASGYLTKGCSSDEMLKAIRAVAAGKPYVAREISTRLAMAQLNGTAAESPFGGLGKREMQVLMLIVEGKKTQDISDIMCLSPKTISTYRNRLHEKLGVETDVELAHLAIRHGLVAQHV